MIDPQRLTDVVLALAGAIFISVHFESWTLGIGIFLIVMSLLHWS